MRFLLSLAFLFVCQLGHGKVSEIVQIEEAIEARVASIVHHVDPEAQVSVKLTLFEVEMGLPGTSFDYYGVTSVQTISVEDIKSVSVDILSVEENLPEWVMAKVQSMVKFPGVRVQVNAEPFTPEMLDQIYAHQPGKRILRWFARSIDGLLPYGLGIIALVVSLLATLLAWIFIMLPNFIGKQIGRLVSAIEAVTGNSHDDIAEPLAAAAEVETPGSEAVGNQDDVRSALALSPESLVELMADCYWTGEDRYARWTWDNLLPDTRQKMLGLWKPLGDYARYLQNLKPEAKSFHLHPYYLSPSELRSFDSSIVQEAIDKDLSIWSALPPMRQAKVQLPLEQKVKVLSAPAKDLANVAWPSKNSEPRSLETASDFGELRLEDEVALWENTDLIPEKFRLSAHSLVWVAKLDQDEREKLISRVTASDLARSWVGPEEVLGEIKKVVPEKKWKLTESYLKNMTPSRRSESFVNLSKSAVQILGKSHQEDVDDVQKAS